MAITADMLAAFVAVAERLNMSAAAGALGVGKGVVSKRVSQLEALLGTDLLVRSTRRMALTPAGRVYLDHAAEALGAMRRGEESLRSLRSELTGLIRVTAPVSWGQRVLARLLPGFLASHPGLEVELVLEDRMMDLLAERIDVALRMTATPVPDFVSIPLAPLAWVMCAAPDYLAAHGAPETPEALGGHPCLAYWRVGQDTVWHLARGGRRVDVRVHGRLRANHPEAACQAAVAGLGIGLLPRFVCDSELLSGALVEVLAGWAPVTVFGDQVTAVAPPDRVRFSRNQALLGYLKAALRR